MQYMLLIALSQGHIARSLRVMFDRTAFVLGREINGHFVIISN